MLIEFRVPATEARTVMRVLATMGVSAATIFPGLAGAVTALQEERLFDYSPVGQRS